MSLRGTIVRWRAMRSYLALKVPTGEGQNPVYVRGISELPDAGVKLCER